MAMRARTGNKGRGGQGRPRTARSRQGRGRSSCPWINAQIIAASETGGLHQLVSTILLHLPQMNLVNLSTAIHRLAKLTANDVSVQAELRQHPALEELLRATSAAFACLDSSEAQPQSLSNVAWSLATMRLMNRQLIQVVAGLATSNISSFKPFELSTMLWAFAKLGTIEPTTWCIKPVFQAAATHIMKQVQHFGFRCLATTAWAFATARQRHARLFRSIAAQMVPMVHAANCQEMANTAWAFGTADFHDNQLFTELAEKALARLDNFKPQELSNMLWGFATNGFFHEAFFASSSLAAQRMDLQAQHLANILWAFARVRPRHPVTRATTLALLPLCVARLDTFKPQEVSSTALAVAKAFGVGDDLERGGPIPMPHGVLPVMPPQVREFFSAVTPWALMRLHEFSAQSLANTVSAYGMAHVCGAEVLFAAVGQEVSSRYDKLEPTAFLHLLKGFSAAPQESAGFMVRMLAKGVAHHVQELRPQELQTLSRVCSAALGLRQGRDLTCEELRSCCLSLAAGEGNPGVVAPSLLGLDMDREPASPLPPVSALQDLSLAGALPGEVLGGPPCPAQLLAPVFAPLGGGLTDLALAAHGGAVCHPLQAPPMRTPKMGIGGFIESTPQVRSAGLPHGYCGGRGLPRGLPMEAWPDEELAGNVEPPYRPGEIFDTDIEVGPPLTGCAVLDLGELAHAALVPPPGPPAPQLKLVAARPVPARSLPLQTVEELTAVTEASHAEAIRHAHPQQQKMRRPKIHNQPTVAVPARGPPATAPPGGAPGSDFRWRCSVKNSFLHVELSNNSEDINDESWDAASRDGGSSQRSSSVPSRFDHEDISEERIRRQQDQTHQDWTRRHPDLDNLGFDWGVPQRRHPAAVETPCAPYIVPTRTPPLGLGPELAVCAPVLAEPPLLLPAPALLGGPQDIGSRIPDPDVYGPMPLCSAHRSTPHRDLAHASPETYGMILTV
mmetsp:Transcript_109755/g.321301  ORF Transcript_109755/g.321301 Transcript_109755/m.321301 type:complete len:958 (-) Transcript_109755:96-2969(-)